MKKSIFLSATALMALGLASCSSDAPDQPVAGDGVQFRVSLGQVGTRAEFADGLQADRLDYAVYDLDGKFVLQGDTQFGNALETTVSIPLVNGLGYQIAFFAHEGNGAYTFDAENGTFTADFDKMGADNNSVDHDAFFKLETIEKVDGAMQRTIVLKRPVARINWGTSDINDPAVVHESAYGAGAANLTSKVTVKGVYTTFNMLEQKVEGEATEIEFTAQARPQDSPTLKVPAFPYEPEKHEYVSMQYILVPGESSVVDAEWIPYNNGTEMPKVTVPNCPVQANYNTNIYGALLTSPVDFKVIKNEIFDGNYNNAVVKDLESFNAAFDAGKNIVVPEDVTIDLPADKEYVLADGQEIEVLGNINTNKGYQFQVTTGEATIKGAPGKENVITANGEGAEGRGIVQIYSGATLNMENVKLVTDYNTRGWTIDVEGGTVNLKNVDVVCDNASLCTIPGSTVNIEGGSFYSTSSSDVIDGVKRVHNYSVRIEGEGTKAYIKDANIFGVQGGICVGYDAYCEIDGGEYASAPVGEFKNSHYALYVFTNGTAVVKDGYFKAEPNKYATFDGNNDTTDIFAARISLQGGYYSDKGHNQKTKGEIDPEEGYEYVESGNAEYPWKVVKKQ